MDALTRLRRSLVGGDEEELPEDSILGDTEDLCSLSPLQDPDSPTPQFTHSVQHDAFYEFAEANEIDYNVTNDQIDVLEQELLKEPEWVKYYVDDPQIRKLANIGGLLYMPKVINKIVRMTFYPRGGNSDAIRDYYWNIIDYIMQGQVFDVVLLMMKR
ncbi:hypothetical protein PR202_gb27144 [Eleusine coracana subsp. coracana]|uniref:Uncharacterized protein n=1 Tax=Eleusine coracana subsp. coracana TaxID=191504 RepID=A0AAV5FV43_ELECO|nr:hypothetical protein PR202_gb27144 [Eleusine coracana subsp. coracana]